MITYGERRGNVCGLQDNLARTMWLACV